MSRISVQPDATRAGWLAMSAMVGVVLFNLAWLVLGFVSPGYMLWDMWISPYSPISQGISGLGLGVTGPYLNTAFVVAGVLIILGAVGIFRSVDGLGRGTRLACIILFALHGVGAILDGIFTLEDFFPHFIGFILALTPIVGFVVAGRALRRLPDWARWSPWLVAAGPMTLVLAITYFATFDPVAAGEGIGIGGLTERVLILFMHFWIAEMGWRAYRITRGPSRTSQVPVGPSSA